MNNIMQQIVQSKVRKSSNRFSVGSTTASKNPFLNVVSTEDVDRVKSFEEWDAQNSSKKDYVDLRNASYRFPITIKPSIRSTEEYKYVQAREQLRAKPNIKISNVPSKFLYQPASSAELNRMLNESANLKEFDKKDRQHSIFRTRARFVDKESLTKLWQRVVNYKAYLTKWTQEQAADLDKTSRFGAANIQKTVVDVPINIVPAVTEVKATAPATTLAASVFGMSRSNYIKGDNAKSLSFADVIQAQVAKELKELEARAARQSQNDAKEYLKRSFEKKEQEQEELNKLAEERRKQGNTNEKMRNLFGFLNQPIVTKPKQNNEKSESFDIFNDFNDIFSDENVKKKNVLTN